MSSTVDAHRQPEHVDRRRLIRGTLWTLISMVLLLFVPAGSLAWFKGWLFVVVILVMMTPVSFYLKRVNPMSSPRGSIVITERRVGTGSW